MINVDLNKFYRLIFNKSNDKAENETKLELKHDQVNNLVASDIRKETFDGIQYVVYPVVMIKHTVVNGSLVELDDLVSESWNGVPVTVNHPTIKGNDVSANHPEVLAKFEVGRIFNASLDGDKLKAEVWIDVNKANSKFPDLLAQMEKSDMEVSTGYFALDIPNEGTFDNKTHKNQHKDIKPDHLALLPDDVGACSFEDGCGIRANALQVFFNKAIDKIKGNEDKEVISLVENSLKALQADIETILKEGKNMTEKTKSDDVKNNCQGLTQEEKEDLAFLRNQIKTQKEDLATQAAKKLGVEKDTLESWSLEQLNTVVNSKVEENKEETTTEKSEDKSKDKDYSGRANATKKTEDEKDYSDMKPFSLTDLVKKKDAK